MLYGCIALNGNVYGVTVFYSVSVFYVSYWVAYVIIVVSIIHMCLILPQCVSDVIVSLSALPVVTPRR